MLLQHLSELFFAKVCQLLALIAVNLRPDVDRDGASLANLRKNLTHVLIAVHARTENVL